MEISQEIYDSAGEIAQESRLTERQALVLLLYEKKNWKYKHIAGALDGIEISTVGNTLKDARDKIRNAESTLKVLREKGVKPGDL